MRSGGIGLLIVIILGMILGFRALYRLLKMRRYIRFTLYVSFFFGYPIVGYNLYLFIDQVEDVHTRLWVGIPVLLAAIIWLFFGLMMNKKVENIARNIDYKDRFSQRRRIIGLFVSATALLVWIGGMKSYFGSSEVMDILAPCLISFMFFLGSIYLVTGKPLEKMDE